MYDMKVICTRDLVHRAARVSQALRSGQTLLWTSRGQLIARLVPPPDRKATAVLDWVKRAKEAGAVRRGKVLASTVVSALRG